MPQFWRALVRLRLWSSAWLATLLLFVFPFAMAYAAASDLLTMRIANSVSLGLVAAFLVIALIAGMPAQEMLLHLAVGAGFSSLEWCCSA